jgi:hypothetical protein
MSQFSRASWADKLPGWNRRSPAKKLKHLFAMDLDRICDYLAWRTESRGAAVATRA